MNEHPRAGLLNSIARGSFTFLTLFFAATLGARAGGHPIVGTLSGLVDQDYIQYTCKLARSSTLNCSFQQVKVKSTIKADSLAKALQNLPRL